MESILDLIARQLASVAGPGFLAGAAAVTLVLSSGLAARVIETCEAMNPTTPVMLRIRLLSESTWKVLSTSSSKVRAAVGADRGLGTAAEEPTSLVSQALSIHT